MEGGAEWRRREDDWLGTGTGRQGHKFASLAGARLTRVGEGAGRSVLSCLAEHRQPSGLFLAQFHCHFIGFLILVLLFKDKVIHPKAPVVWREQLLEGWSRPFLCSPAPVLTPSAGGCRMSFLHSTLQPSWIMGHLSILLVSISLLKGLSLS